LLKYEYPFAPLATDDPRKYSLDYHLDFHSRVTQYEKLFHIFGKWFPKSTLQLAKMIENVNDCFRPKGFCSDRILPTLFQQAVNIQNPLVVSYMIKNREPCLDEEFMWFCLNPPPFPGEKMLINILWLALYEPEVVSNDVVVETFKVLVESLDYERAKKMINAPCGSTRRTCLHLAAERIDHCRMHFATFKLLIKKGADVLLRDKDGNTAYDIIQKTVIQRKQNERIAWNEDELKKIARYLHKKVKQAQKNKMSLTISKQNKQKQNNSGKRKIDLRKKFIQLINFISMVVVFAFVPLLSE
jgi:hypothetical protein